MQREREKGLSPSDSKTYCIPCQLTLHIEIFPSVCLCMCPSEVKPSHLKFHDFEKVFGSDSYVCQLHAICEHLARCLQ